MTSPESNRIGPYHIVQRLGEGGMGTVYLAEQREPVHRRVALKVVKHGADTETFLRRFDAERQALAMMEHSAIAKVYDAGATERGDPYLAMEFVKGEPITEYCDQNRLGFRERLDLFRKVCSGVQHAHQKGVMHRDLKPSNVLVTVQDGQPVPKIIDFGLAKAVDHRLVAATLVTEAGQLLGTPEYMSPEQAGVGGLDLDTRTDVYSLGVLLYELLTGALPISREELMRAGWLEMQRVIREDEPKRPSTRITTLGALAEQHAKARRLPVGELQRSLQGDLDWIVMKALEKDRTRRYQTVSELAADLERYEREEPVTAGPPTAGYLLGKVYRRYRKQAQLALAFVLTVTVGLGVAVWQWREADAQRRVADEQKRRAETLLVDFKRLGDGVRLRRFQERAATEILPEGSARAAALQQWVADVEAWLHGLPDHGAALVDLRRRARVVGDRPVFEDPNEQVVHDALAEFVAGLAAFRAPGGPLAEAKDSLEWSQRVRKVSIDEQKEAWDAAITAVARHPKFGARQIAPQEGLVPLGQDPDSDLQAFWLPRSGQRPERDPQTGRFRITGDTGIVLLLVPGGVADLGTPQSQGGWENEWQADQQPLLDPFFLGKYEVTQGQWQRLAAGVNPSKWAPDPRPGAPTLHNPVENVTIDEALHWARRRGWDLPTEAQWEHACRAGTRTKWWFGDARNSLVRDGRGRFNAADGLQSREPGQAVPDAKFWPELDDGYVVHAPVGSYEPTGFGLHDMHGNVAELTRGTYGFYDQLRFGPGDGELLGGKTDEVVVRGGSYFRAVEDATCSRRVTIARTARTANIGLRITRRLE